MGKMLIDGELREKPSADNGRFIRLESGFATGSAAMAARNFRRRPGDTIFISPKRAPGRTVQQLCGPLRAWTRSSPRPA